MNNKKSLSRIFLSAILTAGIGVSAFANAVVYQAENYNAFYDTTPGNAGGVFRGDAVDIEGTSDAGGGYNVGWIVQGEWLAFNGLNIPTTGSYTIRLRVASPNGATASVDLNAGSIPLGNFVIPATGGWQNWTTVSRTVNLNAGTYNLGVFAQTSDWNFNWIEITPNNTNPGRTLVFADEFNSINTANWTFETGGGGWGNNERQYYTAGQNAFIQNDAQAGGNVLVIEARRDNPANYNCWYGRCEYTSTRMISRDKKTFTHGRIEARMKLPQTQGIWPAFWMLGNNIGSVGWPNCGEIDIMEHVGFEPTTTHGALHGPGYSGNTPLMGTHNLGEYVNVNYHVYAVEWDANGIRWFRDNIQFYSVTRAQVQGYGNWVFDSPFFLLLNVAVGGTWPGSPDAGSVFPQRMYVDYVRVYQ
ncbi:MAG TPA: family 16 glycosylhydrolase [Cellvibrio sp.]|nr:family 16 glycosylhydrolase [Cellvibrio sp.]